MVSCEERFVKLRFFVLYVLCGEESGSGSHHSLAPGPLARILQA
jgi:hypothetical protein